MIIRPTITVATAVAARIVKNQYSRFPCNRKCLAFLAALGGAAATFDCVREAVEPRIDPVGLFIRRWGDIQGQIVWNWRLLSTPDRP
jgi:hypothetical protein